MPSKPRKYELKIFWACKSSTRYALNAVITVGKECAHKIEKLLILENMIFCEEYIGSYMTMFLKLFCDQVRNLNVTFVHFVVFIFNNHLLT